MYKAQVYEIHVFSLMEFSFPHILWVRIQDKFSGPNRIWPFGSSALI